MQAVIIAKGNGYEGDKTFEPYEVVRHPCPKREDRTTFSYSGRFEPTPDETPPGSVRVTHESHSVALAKEKGERRSSTSYILLEHGGGRRVIAVHTSDDWRAAIIALPERQAYEVLRTTAALAESADYEAARRTRSQWARAFIQGRIKKGRVKQNRCSVDLAPWYEAKTPGIKANRESGAVFEIKGGEGEDAPDGFYFFREPKGVAYGPYKTADDAETAKGGRPGNQAVIPLNGEVASFY